jgi:hypothetical protein
LWIASATTTPVGARLRRMIPALFAPQARVPAVFTLADEPLPRRLLPAQLKPGV